MSIFTENPVLRKELTTRFHLRRQSRANQIAIAVITGLVIPILYYFSIRGMFAGDGIGHDAYTIFLLGVEVSLVVLVAPALTAGSISMEREKQTWNALLLSRLTRAQIVFGKFLGAIVPAFVMLGIFFPLNVIAAVRGHVSLGMFVTSHALLIAIVLFYGAIGMFASWACRRTQVATAVAATCVAALVLGTYLAFALWQMAMAPLYGYSNVNDKDFGLLWSNPYYAMYSLLEGERMNMGATIAVVNLLLSSLGTVGLLGLVTLRLGQGPKEMSA